MNTRQAIDTAPKNGATISGWSEIHGLVYLDWRSMDDAYGEGGGIYALHYEADSAWFVAGQYPPEVISDNELPTHWQPRPRTPDELENVEPCAGVGRYLKYCPYCGERLEASE